MSKPIIKIHDVETGVIIEREMNEAEFAQYEIDRLAHEASLAEVTTP
jgi:hypothetical protein